jgi:hypothetical protein
VRNPSEEQCTRTGLEPICLELGGPASGVSVTLTLPTNRASFYWSHGDHYFVCPADAPYVMTCRHGALATNDTAYLSICVLAPHPQGPLTISAVADPNNTIAERSETNNTASYTVTVPWS